jgi:hypothetical protein
VRENRFPCMWMKRSLLLPAVLLALSGASHAQAPLSPATPPAQTAPPAPATSTECAPPPPRGTVAPQGSTTGQATEPLGDRLAKSNGVLCPPTGVDPEMRAPTPDAGGRMPVIPPPGSPGGNPNVQPK